MPTIKITDKGTKAQIQALSNEKNQLHEQISVKENQRKQILIKYKDQFCEMFLNKVFKIEDKSRDTKSKRYITINKIGDPYLIHDNTVVTCHIAGTQLDISTHKWDKQIVERISWTNHENYYAHTDMVEVTEAEYQREWKKCISKMCN